MPMRTDEGDNEICDKTFPCPQQHRPRLNSHVNLESSGRTIAVES